MGRILVNLRDRMRSAHLSVEANDWQVILGALAADPETIDELEQSIMRFRDPEDEPNAWGWGVELQPGMNWDGPGEKVLVDLAARYIAVDARLVCPERFDRVMENVRGAEVDRRVTIDYELARDWEIAGSLNGWQERTQSRREQRAEGTAEDYRAVLYGEVVAFLLRNLNEGNWEDRERITRLHEMWLMTPREDLGGRTPREVILWDLERIDRDLEARSRQWSRLGRCPVGVSKSSAAYRCGAWGRHEAIVYYDMIRVVLDRMIDDRSQGVDATAPAQLRLYEELRLRWMAQPQEEFGGRTPLEIVEHERQRLPVAAGEQESCIDPDCPLCRMMADQATGPAFWFLDGSHMDSDFAFSFCASRAEWHVQYGDEPDDSDSTEVLAIAGTTPRSSRISEVWKGSFMNEELVATMSGQQRLTVVLFGIGGHLAELAEDLRGDRGAAETIRCLLTRFDGLRMALRDKEGWLGRSLVQQCCDELGVLSGLRPALASKCQDLERKFRWLGDLAESMASSIDLTS
ncbi:MAG: hypothetical protein FJ295_14045 [Planctomycetes bacterium]|nr:hypothetical protein [Planctomycetota bacterium]